MKVLVTGGAGFIGSNFVRYWLKNHPHDFVVNFDALTYAGNINSLNDIVSNPDYNKRYKFIKGDLRDKMAVREAMQGVDLVAHFAACSHVDRSIVEPDIFVQTNVLGTQTLLDEAMKANVWRFHHVSTDEVYGTLDVDGDDLFTEETRYQPNNPYSASKAGSDCIVRAYHKTYNFPATITNTSNNFGSYQFPEKYIPLCITRILEGKNIRVHGDGNHIRDWLYVEDHCRAIEAVLRHGRMGEVYLVAGHAQLSILEVAKRICKLMGVGEDRIEFVPDRPNNDSAYKLDWSKIKNELKWEPQFSFDQWLEKTVAWYIENPQWWQPLVKQGFSWGSVGHATNQASSEVQTAAFSFNAEQNSFEVDMTSVKTEVAQAVPIAEQSAYGAAAVQIDQAELADRNPVTYLETSEAGLISPKNQKRILIFGKGQLSMHYAKYFEGAGHSVTIVARPEVSIDNIEQVRQAIKRNKPDIVLNAAGITNVDWAEEHQDETYKTNVIGPENIGTVCKEAGVYMVHLSSGCVHHCESVADVRTEESHVNPMSYYTLSKAKADEALLRLGQQGLKVLIVRPRQLLSALPHPKNVLAKMLVYSQFHNNPNSMTIIEDLIWVTGELIKRDRTGLYNVVNPGLTSPFKIAGMLKEIINLDMNISILTKDEIDAKYAVKRPDAILSTAKLNQEGIFLPDITERLREIITVLRDNLLNTSSQQILADTASENESKMKMKQDRIISEMLGGSKA